MTNLVDNILLYHGSYAEIPKIDLGKCNEGKDFGRGFYVTSSYEQAKRFVLLSIKRQVREGSLPNDWPVGYISVYRFHLTSSISAHIFPNADKDWLHFVASNRKKGIFRESNEIYTKYDIIGGKIANDRTARTLQLYISGGYGEPGSKGADDIAIMTLLPNRLEDQFCFRSLKAVQTLEFVRSDLYDLRNRTT